jgi:hypothetical protein
MKELLDTLFDGLIYAVIVICWTASIVLAGLTVYLTFTTHTAQPALMLTVGISLTYGVVLSLFFLHMQKPVKDEK